MKTILLIMCLSLSSVICTAQGGGAAKAKTGKADNEKLIWCVKEGDEDCVAQALAAGADANAADKEGAALTLAAERQSVSIVRLLLNAGAKVNREGEGQGTALCRAALFGREEIVEALLKAGAKINVVCDGDHGDTPLMDALRGAWLRAMPSDLQEEFTGTRNGDEGAAGAGAADESKEKEDKWREVLKSPRDSFIAIARSLIERGADVNVVAKCDVGETALMYAASSADIEMVKAILSHGADVKKGTPVLAQLREFENEFGKSKSLGLPALSKEQSAMLEWNEKTKAAREEIKRLLKAAGAEEVQEDDREKAETEEETAEEIAADALSGTIKKGDMEDLERLITAYSAHPLGARVLPEAVRVAIIYNRREMVRLLLARGVDPNGTRYKPLIQAANHGDLESVQMLLEAGADVNATEDDGRTALDCAESWGDSDEKQRAIIEALKACGAQSKRQK